MNIIGDDMLAQNEQWIEKLAEFIRDVHNNHKHVKLIGIQFGSQLIGYALGGQIGTVPSIATDTKAFFIGKE
jgi:GMP synthase-like glutamine amidotransferase